jgi:hypothetical protein
VEDPGAVGQRPGSVGQITPRYSIVIPDEPKRFDPESILNFQASEKGVLACARTTTRQRMTSVFMRLGTCPTGIVATAFLVATSIAVTELKVELPT